MVSSQQWSRCSPERSSVVDADVVGQGIVNRPDMVETAYDCISPHSGERKPFLGGDLIADRRSAEEVEGDEMSSGTYG